MKIATFIMFAGLAPVAYAVVYAPLPEQKRGSDVIVSLATEIGYDSNVLGSSGLAGAPETESAVWSLVPGVQLNTSLTDQTFAIAKYEANIRMFEDRDQQINATTIANNKETLVNHSLTGQIEHSFNERFTLSVSDRFVSVDEPETAFTGTAFVNADQSYNLNRFDVRLDAGITEKHATAVKYSNTLYSYDAPTTSLLLDRDVNLVGLEYRYNYSRTSALVAEYRYEDVAYDNELINTNSNDSSFYLIGADSRLSDQLMVQGRLGARDREYDLTALGDDTSFYGQIMSRYNYAEASYLSGGFTFDTIETTSPGLYSGEDSLTLFFNGQHQIAPTWYISGSIGYTTSELVKSANAPANTADITDDKINFGATLTWTPTEDLAIYLNYAHNNISSDDAARELERHRMGVGVRYSFGYNFSR